jgi:hypothetical protein
LLERVTQSMARFSAFHSLANVLHYVGMPF